MTTVNYEVGNKYFSSYSEAKNYSIETKQEMKLIYLEQHNSELKNVIFLDD